MRIEPKTIDPVTARRFGFTVPKLIEQAQDAPETFFSSYDWRMQCTETGNRDQWRHMEIERVKKSAKVLRIDETVCLCTYGFTPRSAATSVRRDYAMEERARGIKKQTQESLHDARRAMANLGIVLRPLEGEEQLIADRTLADLRPLVVGILGDLEHVAAIVARNCGNDCGTDYTADFDEIPSDLSDWTK